MKSNSFVSIPALVCTPINCAINDHSVRGDSPVSKRAFFSCAVVLVVVFLVAIQQKTLAQPTTYSIGTLPNWDRNSGITGFSDSGNSNIGSTMTVGQTFRINNGNAVVTSIAFPLFANAPLYAPGPSDFQVGVVAWNGTRPTGSLLYLSDHLVGYGSVWQNFVVTPNNLILNRGQQYLLFFSGIDFLDGLDSEASMGYVPGNPYTDGQYFFLGLGGSGLGINNLFAHDWTPVAADLAFAVNYQIVPEPAGIVLLGLGSALLILRRKILPGLVVVSSDGLLALPQAKAGRRAG
jgi:hypothetical protein